MNKSADAIVKEISETVDNGEHFWDLCSSIKYFAEKIDIEKPRLSLTEYEKILYKFNDLIEISFMLNVNYKAFIESNHEFKKANPEFDVYKLHHETVKAINDKLTEIESKFDEYYNENSGGAANE